MSRDGYLPPGVQQHHIDAQLEADGPDDWYEREGRLLDGAHLPRCPSCGLAHEEEAWTTTVACQGCGWTALPPCAACGRPVVGYEDTYCGPRCALVGAGILPRSAVKPVVPTWPSPGTVVLVNAGEDDDAPDTREEATVVRRFWDRLAGPCAAVALHSTGQHVLRSTADCYPTEQPPPLTPPAAAEPQGLDGDVPF